MEENLLWLSVQRFLGKEARLLDEKKWDDWLSLYDPEAEYWLPAMGDDGELIQDPQREISLIYYPNRAGLEDRVFRIRTGMSSASTPEIRTLHMFTLLSTEQVGNSVNARSSWITNSIREDHVIVYRGWSDYDLVAAGSDSWSIKKKKTVIMDPITEVVDFYNV